VPSPRFDLLKTRHYAFGSVQFSRGCPFRCEFCDIIVVFGRKPRLKSPIQVIAELENLRSHHMSMVFIVDDNLIGNKKAIKDLLRHVISWQRANGFPISFVTEASLDLADDDELMRLMVDAGIEAVFVGIESTSEDSLREAKKLQNVRGSDSMVDKVRRIQAAGMEVWAGMILGFDNDDKTAFEAQKRFLQSARINTAMIGMLAALPKTPLHARLAAAGRLDSADTPAHGTNVIPLRMSRNELNEGYVRLMVAVYDWRTYFARLDDLYVDGGLEIDRAWQQYATRHPWRRRARHARFLLEAFGILLRLMARVPDYSLRSVYRHQFLHLLCARRNPAVLRVYAIKCAVHFHMHTFVRALVARDHALLNTF
jgi:radical SAM superfamily enzyme YgiQ (UPF0313 family)